MHALIPEQCTRYAHLSEHGKSTRSATGGGQRCHIGPSHLTARPAQYFTQVRRAMIERDIDMLPRIARGGRKYCANSALSTGPNLRADVSMTHPS